MKAVARARPQNTLPFAAVLIGFALSSTSAADTLSGTIVDQVTGAPVANAQVSILGLDLAVVADAQGYYHIDNVPPGTYDILFGGQNYQTRLIKTVSIVATQVELQSFSAFVREGMVVLSWTVSTKAAFVGFNLYRSVGAGNEPGRPEAKINAELIRGRSPFHYVDVGVHKAGIYRYQLAVEDRAGQETFFGELSVEITPSSPPRQIQLSQNFPNPFNPLTKIEYDVSSGAPAPSKDRVQLKVFNLRGQPVKTLVNTVQTPGHYVVTWRGDDDTGAPLSSGTYLYRLSVGEVVVTKAMILLK